MFMLNLKFVRANSLGHRHKIDKGTDTKLTKLPHKHPTNIYKHGRPDNPQAPNFASNNIPTLSLLNMTGQPVIWIKSEQHTKDHKGN